MSNPFEVPKPPEWEEKSKKRKIIAFIILTGLCLYETFGLHGFYPNPPLASFYGIAATYIGMSI